MEIKSEITLTITMTGREGIALQEFLDMHEFQGEPTIVKELRKNLGLVRKV